MQCMYAGMDKPFSDPVFQLKGPVFSFVVLLQHFILEKYSCPLGNQGFDFSCPEEIFSCLGLLGNYILSIPDRGSSHYVILKTRFMNMYTITKDAVMRNRNTRQNTKQFRFRRAGRLTG